ncbi:hypothetical protein [Antarcticirhabdus aurantiaca]|uniref:Uncharacterized protein n=1 Tax=Antarcticirhabdus aurantiaca TaxID=2606717 RepID=A0ACD4NNQ4_9HYPH|nr:hypothetical protein OXU80_27155 [Jeongeuplla avenae]
MAPTTALTTCIFRIRKLPAADALAGDPFMAQRYESVRDALGDGEGGAVVEPDAPPSIPFDHDGNDRDANIHRDAMRRREAPRVQVAATSSKRKRCAPASRGTRSRPPAGKTGNASSRPRDPVDESTIWLIDVDLGRNEALRERLIELALALARRIADQDHEAAVIRRTAAAASGASATRRSGSPRRSARVSEG